jgi:hypothetical protein
MRSTYPNDSLHHHLLLNAQGATQAGPPPFQLPALAGPGVEKGWQRDQTKVKGEQCESTCTERN